MINLNKAKTPGPDNIPAFLWKHKLFQTQLLEFCNQTFNSNKPKAFSKSCIIPLPKSRDLQQPSNYRGVTLSAIVSKVCNSLLLNRITPHLDPILRQNENAFRKNRYTANSGNKKNHRGTQDLKEEKLHHICRLFKSVRQCKQNCNDAHPP